MYDGPIIDVDLHHRWASEDELFEYMAPEWQSVVDRSHSRVHIEAPVAQFLHLTGSVRRANSSPAQGGPPDYATVCKQWLDPYPVERAVLTYDIGTSTGVPNPMLSSALCRAANDWSVDRWIEGTKDERLYAAALIPTQIPEDGAAEVRRMAENPRVVEALMVCNGLGKHFGHPAYHPIYEAAAETGLPIAIHNGGDQWNMGSQMNAAGLPNSRFEFHALAAQCTMTHLLSFITYGAFEKFPRLKLMIVEIGVAWLPWLIWSMDKHYETLRQESPWVKRLPSEYIRDHVLVTTQPIEVSPQRGQLVELMGTPGGLEDVLCFASDYPHFDADDPKYTVRRLDDAWGPKVFYGNSKKALRWPDRESADATMAAVGA